MDRVWQGAALRKVRMLARKSIADVATKCRIGQSAVSQWELGISNPGRQHLEQMAELFEMPLELLLYEIGAERAGFKPARACARSRSRGVR